MYTNFLKKMVKKLKNKEDNKQKKEKKSEVEEIKYETLVPVADIKNESVNMLGEILNDKRNLNIAVTGKYGAGKSSIIRSYFKNSKTYKPLYVSLGMLGISEIKDINSNEFGQEIEKSIIQQIIFRENPSNLNESKIKRLWKVNFFDFLKVVMYMLAILIVVLEIGKSIYEFNEFGLIRLCSKLSKLKFHEKVIETILFLSGFIIFSGLIYLFLKKVKDKNIKIKVASTELAIEKDSSESLINKYLDELVYFFSVTKYNVVIIEDLDRFIKNEILKNRIILIFQKLKELNQILNTSKQVKSKNKIRFIYAVRDDLFMNDEERTKFFDVIVPVVPVISNFNSEAELTKKLQLKDNKNAVGSEIIQRVAPYINDFRVIKNIKNEYLLYRMELDRTSVTNDKLFAMIALKNLIPNEYEDLVNNKGIIYNKLHKEKDEIVNKIINNINEKVKNNSIEIEKLKQEKLENIKELKKLAISNIAGKSTNKSKNSSNNGFTIEEFLKDDITIKKIEAFNNIEIKNYNGYYFEDEELFEYFGGKEKFIERGKNIELRANGQIEELLNQNNKYENKVLSYYEKSYRQLINDDEYCILEKKDENKDSSQKQKEKFIDMLLENGYIDENYKNYMFKFIETTGMTINDSEFRLNVLQENKKGYTYKLDNIEEVIKRINESWFNNESILNNGIARYFINENVYVDKKNRFFNMISSDLDSYKLEFIFQFIIRLENKNKEKFLKELYNKNSKIFSLIFNNNIEIENKETKVDGLIKDIINIPSILKDAETNEYITKYLIDKEEFSVWTNLTNSMKESLKILNIKFNKISSKTSKDQNFMNFIIDNKLYDINLNVLERIFELKGLTTENFEQENLTSIFENEKLNDVREYIILNQEKYIRDCYLKTSGNLENIKYIVECINKWEISRELKTKMIEHMTQKLDNINGIEDDEYFDDLIVKNKVKALWKNYYTYYCYKDKKITKELIKNIEQNIDELEKDSISNDILGVENQQNFVNFKGNLLRCNTIDTSIYNRIILICKIDLGNISENEIENDKMKLLIESDKISMNEENLYIIYNQVPEYVDVFIKNRMDKFIDEINDYSIDDEEFVEKIVLSKNIKYNQKRKIIDKLDSNLFNAKSMEYIIKNYAKNKISEINEELKDVMFNKEDLKTENKVDLLVKEIEFNNISKEKIKKYIEMMPETYKYIGNYTKKNIVSLETNDLNRKLIKKLESKNFISSHKENKRKIVVYNKK